ncbi:hypothetical protein HDU67_001784 [Dinochytrium kinnereticum]|nr:hypothetical protein HDU67_001784 [Dinochytrium kinnereticum]
MDGVAKVEAHPTAPTQEPHTPAPGPALDTPNLSDAAQTIDVNEGKTCKDDDAPNQESNVEGDPDEDDDLEDFDVEAAIKEELEALKSKEGEDVEDLDELMPIIPLDDQPMPQPEVMEAGATVNATSGDPVNPTRGTVSRRESEQINDGGLKRKESLVPDGVSNLSYVEDISSIDLRVESSLEQMSSWGDLLESVGQRDSERHANQLKMEKDADEGLTDVKPIMNDTKSQEGEDTSGNTMTSSDLSESHRPSVKEIVALKNNLKEDYNASMDGMESSSSLGPIELREKNVGGSDQSNLGGFQLSHGGTARTSMGSRFSDDLMDDSDDEFELPEELKREKEALDRRLKELESEQKSEESLLEALRFDHEHSISKRPAAKKRIHKPKIRHPLLGAGKDEAEAAPWLSKEDLLNPEEKMVRSMSASSIGMEITDRTPIRSRRASSVVDSSGSSIASNLNALAPSASDGNIISRRSSNQIGKAPETVGLPVESIVITNEEENANNELATLSAQERELKIEYRTLQESLKNESEKQSQLQLKLETQQSSVNLQRRAIRATKMKVRELEDRCRQVIHWLSVVAKVAFEKEKDRSNALLQKCAKRMDKFRKQQEQTTIKIESLRAQIVEISSAQESSVVEIGELKRSEEVSSAEVEALRLELEELAQMVAAKKEVRERELLQKLQAEEAQRQFEMSLLKDACAKQRPAKPVDFEDLLIYEAIDKGLQKVPYIKVASHLLHVSLDCNQISSTRGLETLTRLVSLSLNRNKFQTLDLAPFDGVRFLAACSNKISKIQYIHKCIDLLWINLSHNPIQQLDALGPNEVIQIIEMNDTELEDVTAFEQVSNLLYLDVSKTRIGNATLDPLAQCPILQFLNISGNQYTSVPDIQNVGLQHLNLQFNSIRRLNVLSWLPRLRILRADDCKIESIEPLSMCPFLIELSLSENNLKGKRENRDIYAIASCRMLRNLDLTNNAVSNVKDFYSVIFALFPDIQTLNRIPFSRACRPKDIPGYKEPGALKQVSVWKDCIKFYSRQNLIHPEERPALREKWDDFMRAKASFSDLANLALLDEAKSTIEELQISYAQACWRRIQSERKAKVRRDAVLKIQAWIKGKLNVVKRAKEIVQVKSATAIQKLWRGHRVRKFVKKLRSLLPATDEEEYEELEDTSLLEWIDNVQENAFDDNMTQYLKDETLQHFSNINPNMFKKARRGLTSRERPSTSNAPYPDQDGEVNFSVLKEETPLHWTTMRQGSLIRHEELPPLGNFEANLVDFDPLKEYLARKTKPEPNYMEDDSQSEDDWNLKDAKAKAMLARKQARDRLMLHNLHKRDTIRGTRLRTFYKHAYKNLTEVNMPSNDVSSSARATSPARSTMGVHGGMKASGKVVYQWDFEVTDPQPLNPMPKLPEINKGEPGRISYQDLKFSTDPGVTLLINNYVANKVVGNIPRHVDPTSSCNQPGPINDSRGKQSRNGGRLPAIKNDHGA